MSTSRVRENNLLGVDSSGVSILGYLCPLPLLPLPVHAPDIEDSKEEIITIHYEMSRMHMKGCGISGFACVVARMSSGQV